MANKITKPFTCQSFYINPQTTSKDKLAGAGISALINNYKTLTYIPFMLRASTLIPAPMFASTLANLVAKYSKQKLQHLIKICIKAKN